MAQQVTITARGLFLGQNDLGAVPDGALGQADNCVISKDGIVETRRGLANVATKALARLFQFKNYLVGWAATNVLSRSSDNGATWTDYSGTYPAPVSPFRAAEMNGNLYFTSSTGPYRFDRFPGSPVPAGIPPGLDIQPTLGAAGTAVPPGNQVAYRIVWGKRDANGNLLLGAPSGRGIVTQPAPYVIAIGNLARVTNVVTATLSAGITNVFRVGESVTLSPGEASFAAGVKTLTAVTATTFSYAEAAADATSTVAETFTGPSRDITVTATIARNLPSGAFYQVYRSPGSGLETQTPDDNLGLVYEGTPPTSKTLTQLARASGTTVTATTSTDHGYSTGMVVTVPSPARSGTYVAVGEAVAGVGRVLYTTAGTSWNNTSIAGPNVYNGVVWNGSIFCAVTSSSAGVGGAATSPDGITWMGRNIPGTDTYRGITWNGSIFCTVGAAAAGVGGVATSPDGITWTVRNVPGTGTYRGIAWNGSVFAIVGDSAACSSSTDGITWTNRTLPAGNYYSVAWNGSLFAAVGAAGKCATSPDGITWTARTIPTGAWHGIAWNGSIFAAVGGGVSDGVAATSVDGITWISRTIPGISYNGVGWSGDQFMAIGGIPPGGTASVAMSPDGIVWTDRSPFSLALLAVAFTGTVFGSGDKVILSAPTTTTFTYTQWGNNGTVGGLSQTLTPLDLSFTDSIPSAFIGAALYTNPNEPAGHPRGLRPPGGLGV